MSDIILSVVFPCYNEEKNIPLIIENLSDILKKKEIEIIFVNNGSIDNSADVLKKASKDNNFRIVTVEKNQGYGYGILQGLNASKGGFLGWMHADMQTDPKDLLKALDIIEKNNSSQKLYIKGIRRGRKFFDNVFSVGMGIFESLYLGTSLWEINAQPNIFHRSFYDNWKKPPYDFSLDLYAYYLAKNKQLTIKRFDVIFPDRIYGKSSWNNSFSDRITFIKRTLSYSKTLKAHLNNINV